MKNVALITWASSGLGKEFAYIHAQNGGNLVLIARRVEKLEKIKEDIEKNFNVSVYVIAKDLTSENVVQEIYSELKEKNIIVEYLINNAGFWWIWKFSRRSWKDESSMITLNITVTTELCHIFLPDMITRNSGKILNVSSTASLLPWPNQAVYYATKAFVTSLSNALAEELYDSDVSVTALLPWPTQTEFWAVSGMDKTSLFSKLANPRQVALDWYNGMQEWKLNVLSVWRFSQKILMKMIPFLPKKLLLKMVREWQEVK